ncbi:hypothetical protein ACS0TY_021777 [Phlomoides rotata]
MDGSVQELMIMRSLGVAGRPRQPRAPIPVHWFPPQAGWYTANVDGSASLAPGCLYVGVVFRNSRGFFAGAFCTPVGRGYPLEAELAAILHSILFAYAQGWSYLRVESDSSLAIDTILKKIHLIPWRLYGLWCKAMEANGAADTLTKLHREEVAPDMTIMYSHIFREAKQAADNLAKLHREAVCNCIFS